MWKRFFFIAISLLMCWQIFGQKTPQAQYIDRYKAIAIKEMQRSGVPASIKLAQGILESDSGRSTLARRANNHFGMKCGSAWRGKTYDKEDDDYDADGNLVKSCFRVYKNGEASYIAHSEFLRDPNKNYRYGFLFRLDPLDYKAWARGLKKAGYATSPTYAQNIINTVERYELFRYDRMTTVDEEVSEIIADVPKINGVRVTLANGGETPADIALRSSVSISRLLKYNERLNEPAQQLKKNERVFLQPKRNGYRGKKKYHFVKANESMFSIAQQYGVKMSKLYKRNRMAEGSQAAEGEQIKLRGWKVKTRPRLRSEAPEEEGNTEFEWEENVPDIDEQSGFEIEFNDDETGTPDSNTPEVEDTERVFHRVLAGETLFGLSRKYGTTVEQIKEFNNLTSNVISVGQELRVK